MEERGRRVVHSLIVIALVGIAVIGVMPPTAVHAPSSLATHVVAVGAEGGVSGSPVLSEWLRIERLRAMTSELVPIDRPPNLPSPLAGQFVPPHSDRGHDTNGNGLYDFLVVEVNFMVDARDDYRVAGLLYESTGELFLLNETGGNLDPGSWSMSVYFEGGPIAASGLDGSYTVDLFLFDGASNLLAMDSHTTQAYGSADFEPPPAELAPPHAEQAFDSDGDGLLNVLNLEVNIVVRQPGEYGVLGILYDPSLALLWFSAGWAVLEPGPRTVVVPFPGYAFKETRIDGPYTVDLVLVDVRSLKPLGSDQHTTGPWNHADFEEMPSLPSGFAGSAPTIDGVIGPSEWDDAYTEDLGAFPGNGVSALLHVMNDYDFLYVAYDAIGDTSEESNDSASLAFDTDNDGVPTDGREDQFLQGGLAPGGQAHYVFDEVAWTVEDAPYDPGLPDHAGLASARGFGSTQAGPTAHRVYEFRIPLDLLGARPGETLGFFGGSALIPGLLDDAGPRWSTWPAYAANLVSHGLFGDLVLARGSDQVAPALSITEPSPGALLAAARMTVAWTGSDDDSGLDRFEIQLDGRSLTTLPSTGRSLAITGLSDGAHTIAVTAFDKAENSRTASVSVTVDATPPNVEITAPEDGAALAASDVVVAWSASDAMSGVAHLEIRVDGGQPTILERTATSHTLVGLGDDAHSVALSAFDEAGHSTTASVSFIVDTVAPELLITSPASGVHDQATFEVTWTVVESGSGLDRFEVAVDDATPVTLAGTSMVYALSDLADGSHSIRVEAYDRAGLAASDSVIVTVDTTAPNVAIASPESNTIHDARDIRVTWSASDATSGIDRIDVRVDDGPSESLPAEESSYVFASLPDGTHILTVTAYDMVGNSESETITVIVDTTPPSLSVSTPPAGGFLATSDVEIAWTASDTGTGIDHLELRLDDGPPIERPAGTASYTFQGLPDGPHTIRLTAIDAAGNSAPVTVTVTVDTVGPNVRITSPTADRVITSAGTPIVFIVDDATSGANRIEIRVDSDDPVEVSSTSTSHTIEGLADGVHTVRVTAFDRAGNSGSSEVTFRVDTSFLSPSGPYGSGGVIVVAVVISTAIAAVLLAQRFRKRPKRPAEP